MVELNQQITWVPEHVRDGSFGKWLENARDWSISRNRFWGSPIPVWKSDDPRYPRIDVYGSLDELERDFGVRVDRPAPPRRRRARAARTPTTRPGRSMMRRVPEVLDCWFESGSMPFAQVHYPFENADWFEHHYPGDFIVEYIGQTRGWFYTLHVLATALFDRPAFQHVRVPRHRARRRRPEDVQEPAQLPRPVRDVRHVRRRRHALVPAVVADPARRGPRRERAGHPRRRAPGAAAALERLVLLHALRQRRRTTPAQRAHRPDRRARPLHAGQAARSSSTVVTGDDGRLRPLRRVRRDARLPRRPHQLVHPPQPRPLLERRRRRLRHAHTVLARAHAASPRRCCRSSTEEIYQGLTGERSVHLTDWPDRRRAAGRPRPGARPWTACATSARRPCRSARPTACGCACRWRRCTSTAAGRARPGAVRRPHPGRGQREAGAASPRTSAPTPPTSCRLVPAALGPRLGADMQTVMPRRTRAATTSCGSGSRPSSAASSCSTGEYEVAPRGHRPGALGHPAGRRRRRPARHRRHPRAGGRGPGARPGAHDPAGPARRRAARERPDPAGRAGVAGDDRRRSSRSGASSPTRCSPWSRRSLVDDDLADGEVEVEVETGMSEVTDLYDVVERRGGAARARPARRRALGGHRPPRRRREGAGGGATRRRPGQRRPGRAAGHGARAQGRPTWPSCPAPPPAPSASAWAASTPTTPTPPSSGCSRPAGPGTAHGGGRR